MTIINGPFSAEYGDFSGLGVVHIRQRESLPDQFTVRLQGGNFDTGRGFFAYSPDATTRRRLHRLRRLLHRWPLSKPGRYRRDNINGNYTRTLDDTPKARLPLYLRPQRFLFVRPDPAGSGRRGPAGSFRLHRSQRWRPRQARHRLRLLQQSFANGDTFKLDGFVWAGRSSISIPISLLSERSRSTVTPFQQHDSRLQQGAQRAVYAIPTNFVASQATFSSRRQLPRQPDQRRPIPARRPRAYRRHHSRPRPRHQRRRLCAGEPEPLRRPLDRERRHPLRRIPLQTWMTKSIPRRKRRPIRRPLAGQGHLAFTPTRKIPLTLHANYGRGINSVDARGVVQMPDQPRLATTDFYQVGASVELGPLLFRPPMRS